MKRWVAIVVLLALAGPAFADRVVVKDGPVLEGSVTEKNGFIEVKTAKGTIVRVPKGSVARIESDEAPERLREVKVLLDGAARHPKKKDELSASLAKVHDAFVVPALLDRLEHASSGEERRLAARELAMRPADGVLRALARAVVLDAAAPVRSEAMSSLRRIGDPETGALFVQALGRADPTERTRATAALGTFPRKEAVGVLANLANPGA
ncbi:MAG: HEAT repeat domain-containing protein, partial [Planctomycetota bacterium]